MKKFFLNNFVRGWIVGDFEPTVIKTKGFEFGIKKYNQGEIEQRHFHREAEEVTVIISGIFEMNSGIFKEGDIVFLEKNEEVDFKCLKSGYTAVVKIPSVKNDKYLC